jgi:hypothetical protein
MVFVRVALICAALWAIPVCGVFASDGAAGQVAPPEEARALMSAERLGQLVRALDPGAVAQGRGWRLSIEGQVVLLVTDAAAGRVRAMVPIRAAAELTPEDLQRMLQANFDTALDGRYAIAQGLVWSLYVRPLEGLDKVQLISGLAQVITLARSYGTDYASGALRFGGGDVAGPDQGLLERLMKRGQDI